jgi:hypothetical protein
MPRQARLDTPGTLHHVIVRGEKGHFSRETARLNLREALELFFETASHAEIRQRLRDEI